MMPRLLALLVSVVLACSSQAACAQENVLNVGKYGQLSSYDPHAGALDTMWWTLNSKVVWPPPSKRRKRTSGSWPRSNGR